MPDIGKYQLKVICILLLWIAGLSPAWAQGLKASGKKITDASGNEVILRGMGLGGWMLMEGYMMETSDFANPQREIKAKIESLIGPESTREFYQEWHQNHCTKVDIDSLAAWGFNSVRLPMHYNLFTLPVEQEPVAGEQTWLEEGFALTDSLLRWCSDNQIYLILDLHAAPGGQGRDMAISDYDPSKPSLWESEANKQKTIALWKKLAERYAAEPWIGGYDLINETNWNFTPGANQNGCAETSNTPLRKLLMDITQAIREVDPHHMIIIEGNCWANNYNGILPPWDDNLVVSFHKYWSTNDLGSIQGMLNIRNTHNVPLWLGESGENSNQWFTDAIRLMENNSIGWCWWPMKKVNSVVNPLTIPKNDGYQVLLDYWKNGGTVPSSAFAKNALMELAGNAKAENCIYRRDVIDAMFRQVHDPSTKPFADHHVPGLVHATDFDLGEAGKAYSDKEIADYHVSTGTYTSWNNGWVFRNDGVDIEKSYDADPAANGYNVGWTDAGEWMQYTVTVDSAAAYTLEIRYAAPYGSQPRLRIQCNSTDVAEVVALPPTGDYQVWKTMTIRDVILKKGQQDLRVYIQNPGVNLGYFRFSISGRPSDVTFKPVYAETWKETQKVSLTLNKAVDATGIPSQGFEFLLNGNKTVVSSLAVNPDNPYQLFLMMAEPVADGDIISLNFSGGAIAALDGTVLGEFSNFPVINNLPLHQSIPGKIEAESFSVNHGLQLETTKDSGGGQNIGYTSTGDYLDYRVRVKKTASYTLDARIACMSSAGILEFRQLDANGNLLNSARLDVPVTGGWQKWVTRSVPITLTQGSGTLRVIVIKPEFNINWFRFTEIQQDTILPEEKSIRIYPNPVLEKKELNIIIPDSKGAEKEYSILSMNGTLVKEEMLASAEEKYSIPLNTLSSGMYILQLRSGGITWRSKLMIL